MTRHSARPPIRPWWVLVLGMGAVGCPTACLVELNLSDLEPTSEATAGEPGCSLPLAWCDGECVDTRDDEAHCGGCGDTCESGFVCEGGECVLPCLEPCDAVTEECVDASCICRVDLMRCGDECVDTHANFFHCGVCFRECESGQVCGEGDCLFDCGSNDECSGLCTDLDADPLHCGGCETSCEIDEVCLEGDCFYFDELDPEQCSSCPCPVCAVDDLQCCLVDDLGGEVCIEPAACP